MLFKDTECNFHILTVNIIPSYTGAQSSVRMNQEKIRKNILNDSEAQLKEQLERIKTKVPNPKHKFTIHAVYDYFVEAVNRIVANKNITLIIMGTKGASGLKKVVFGSNTAAVISKVDCPLLAVPENIVYDKPREIVFATDFNVSYNLRMFDVLKDMAIMNKAALRIMNVLKADDALNAEQTKNKEILKDYVKGMEHSFHTLTSTEVEMAIQCFVESRDIDMIAMVAKNKNILQRILFKPTVERVSYFIDIPLLVLRE